MASAAEPPINLTENFDWSGTGRGKHIEFAPGDKFPLEIGRFLGRGSTSDVNETACQGVLVAVKRRYLARGVLAFAPFEKEMKNLERVSDHQHVVKIFGSSSHGRVIGILLWPVAICDLGTLLDDSDTVHQLRLANVARNESNLVQKLGAEGFSRLQTLNVLRPRISHGTWRWSGRRIRHALGCLAGALSYIHEHGIKHKDLKPSNILFTEDNLYITDFGTSTDFSEITTSATDQGHRGTPKYFAPETAKWQPSGRAADVFALGCIYLEILYIYLHIPIARLWNLLPTQDHSYQANLDNIAALLELDYHVGAGWRLEGLGSIKNLLEEMLSKEPKRRPQASKVFNRLDDLVFEWFNASGMAKGDLLLCGECCHPIMDAL